jgi:nucleoside-diphosphate-sugar epimerase
VNEKSQMNILITGASGFIGTYLIKELLPQNHNIITISRKQNHTIPNTKTITADITDISTLTPVFQDIDAVIHNAAYAKDWGKDEQYHTINVIGTRNIAELCRQHKVKHLLYTSTAGIYGFPNNTIPIKESDRPIKKPVNTYGATKIQAENVLQEYTDLKITIIRPPMVFGAGGKPTYLLVSRIQQGRMTYIGRGEKQISIAHPADVAQCFRLALEKGKKGVFNVVSFYCTIQELVEGVAKTLDVPPPTRHIPFSLAYLSGFFSELFAKDEPGFTRFRAIKLGTSRIIDSQKAKVELGFKPRYDLQNTIEDMVRWYKKNK